jgi:hypothetical protein
MRFSRQAAMMLAPILLIPAALRPQILPPQPGKLNVYSKPAGATVYINRNPMTQPTNAAFVVTPGTYQVSVKQSNTTLTCSATPRGKSLSDGIEVSVSAGQTVTINCQ